MQALRWNAMHEGTWTIRPCPRREVRRLATALGVGEATAGVLVRRGYGDPEAARAFLAAEPPGHDPFLLGDVEAACALIRETIAAGGRICVHGDYDVDGICATALAVTALRDLGADVEWHLPSRFEEGYGVSRETLARLVEEGCALVLTVDCGITAVEEIAEARAAGLQVVVTDHHRPGETLPDCPIVATKPSAVPVPGAVRHRGRLQAHGGARRGRPRPPPRPRRAGDGGGRRAAPGREPRARRRRDAAAGADGQARPASAHARGRGRPCDDRHRRDRVPARAAHQRRRAARPPGRRARPPAHRGRGRGAPARRRARGAEPRPPGRRGAHPARRDPAGGGVARAEAPPPRLRDRGRGLAPRRDRDRGLAARRAVPPAGRAHRRRGAGRGLGRLRPLGLRIRPPRRARGLLAPARPLGRAPRGGGPLDRAGERRGLRRGVRRACGRCRSPWRS